MTKAKDMTVPQKLKALYELQLIDSKVDEIQTLKGELPVEVQDLEDDIAGLETRINSLDDSISELEKTIAKYRNDIKTAEELIMKYNKQQDNVKNNREYEALTKEIELQKLDIQLANKRIREAEISIQNKNATKESAVNRLQKKHNDLLIKKKELEKIVAETDKEEEKLNKKADRIRKKIEPRLLKGYDKIRNAYRNGLSVVTIERDSCGGCYNKIPPQVQLEIGMRKKVNTCEHCGRVLVDHGILNAE